MRCQIIPPQLMERIAEHHGDPDVRELARHSLTLDIEQRDARQAVRGLVPPTLAPPARPPKPQPNRTICDAEGGEDLPGRVVRTEGAALSGDAAVDEAYDWLGVTFDFYWKVYQRNSIDGHGLALNATVHYDRNYDNAFWNGRRMVYGDGDGRLFVRFTRSLDVTGHELTHGVTQYTANLDYVDQSGALNESMSDVFGVLAKQYHLGQTVDQADWLVGAELLGPEVHGVALRSMKAPGTAYDDPVLGKDPQPATMAGYVKTEDDNGGVHINSGIPNRAFYLTAAAIGGFAWEKAGQIWYDTLTGGTLPQDADFATFAAATLQAASRRFGATAPEREAVRAAWQEVGVTPKA